MSIDLLFLVSAIVVIYIFAIILVLKDKNKFTNKKKIFMLTLITLLPILGTFIVLFFMTKKGHPNKGYTESSQTICEPDTCSPNYDGIDVSLD